MPSRSKRTVSKRTRRSYRRREYAPARGRRVGFLLPRRASHALGPGVVPALRAVPASARRDRRRCARHARAGSLVHDLHARRAGDRARGLRRGATGERGAIAGAARRGAARGRARRTSCPTRSSSAASRSSGISCSAAASAAGSGSSRAAPAICPTASGIRRSCRRSSPASASAPSSSRAAWATSSTRSASSSAGAPGLPRSWPASYCPRYDNFAHITWENDADQRVRAIVERFGDLVRAAGEGEIVLANGSDHLPVEPELPEILARARREARRGVPHRPVRRPPAGGRTRFRRTKVSSSAAGSRTSCAASTRRASI